jgi:hypothetical protein
MFAIAVAIYRGYSWAGWIALLYFVVSKLLLVLIEERAAYMVFFMIIPFLHVLGALTARYHPDSMKRHAELGSAPL